MNPPTIDTKSEIYLECIEVACWFIEVQTQFLPKIYVPQMFYDRYLLGVTTIVAAECPPFKVIPYEGTVILAVPDLD